MIMKRGFFVFAAVLMAMTILIFAGTGEKSAEPNEPAAKVTSQEKSIVLDCRYFTYALENLSAEDVHAEQAKISANTVEYELHHEAETDIVDTVSADFTAAKTSKTNDIRPSIFTRTMEIKDKKTSKTVVRLKYLIQVDFYESGSFRAFYGASSPMLVIEYAIAPMKLVNIAEGVKSTTGRYPCTSLTYSYSANLCTTEPVTAKVGKLLSGAGFRPTEDLKPYYIATVFDTGTIDLYSRPGK